MRLFQRPAAKLGIKLGLISIITAATTILVMGFEILNYPRVILGLIAGLVIGITIAAILLGRMLKRISALAEKVRFVAGGDFSARAEIKTSGALLGLSEAFNDMVEALSRAHEQLTEKANTDALTDLYNHRFFHERLTIEFSRAHRYKSKLSLLMIDIDHFKLYNDMNGHPAGDQALKCIGHIISRAVRDVDIAARYGGEEFAVILPETGANEAAILAERIRKAVEKHIFDKTNPRASKLTLSLGVAEYPTHCNDRSSLLRAADAALYHAKIQGRNMVITFNGESGEDPKPDPHKLYVLLHATDLSTVEALAAAIDVKHNYPSGHSVDIARLACDIGRKMEFSEDECTSLYVASLLRDIGQIAIPNTILAKSEPLSSEDKMMIENHPILGHAIIQKSPYMSSMLPAVLHHHEHYDGTGYPQKLAGDNIPLSARIIAAADAYQSMLAPRPYRSQMTVEEAQAELRSKSGSQFDPQVVDILLGTVEEREEKAA